MFSDKDESRFEEMSDSIDENFTRLPAAKRCRVSQAEKATLPSGSLMSTEQRRLRRSELRRRNYRRKKEKAGEGLAVQEKSSSHRSGVEGSWEMSDAEEKRSKQNEYSRQH